MSNKCLDKLFLIFIYIFLLKSVKCYVNIDPNGYVVYCPCMGRFGNQAEQFLGALQFSKSINRTMILPPFIEYVDYKINFIPFEDLFEVDRIREYHRVMTMKEFMEKVAQIVWPKEERIITCYGERNFKTDEGENKDSGCNPFEGSPFKEFWHNLGIEDFPRGSLYYKPLHTDFNYANEWKQKFGHIKVLAFVGAPSSFPTNSNAIKLSKYIYFTKNVMENANRYRDKRGFARKPYLAIHLRHGSDWSRACELIHSNPDLKQLFSSQQCMGDRDKLRPYEKITFDLCLPSAEQIIEAIRTSLKTYHDQQQPNEKQIQLIYIATDFNNESLWLELNQTLNSNGQPPLTLITPTLTLNSLDGAFSEFNQQQQSQFIIDLYIMAHGNVFIGNCISSFSAFVSRYRLHRLHFFHNTHFFAFHRPNSIHLRDEL